MSNRTPAQARLKDARPRPCEYCGADKPLLRRTVSGSGVSMYFWLCGECRRNARKKNIWIGHDIIDFWVARGRLERHEDIPIYVEYASEIHCVVCKRPGAEYHHWAPQSLAEFFGDDWASWPGDYLCKEHHDQWHELVTPWLHGRRSTERAQAVTAWAQGAQP